MKLFLAFLSGVLTGLSFDFPRLFIFAWFSLLPLFYLLYNSRRPEWYFFVSALVCYYVSLGWVSFVTTLGMTVLIIYLSFYWWLFGFAGKYLRGKRGSLVSLPALWVVLEFIRENIPVYGFGWNILGYSQYKNFFLIQIADLVGAKGLSFLIVTVNLVIFQCLRKERKCSARLVYGVLLICLSLSYGVFRTKLIGHESEGNVCIEVVQPDVPQMLKWRKDARSRIITKLIDLGRRTKKGCLVVYPEAAWPDIVDVDEPLPLVELTSEVHRDVLLGAVIRKKDKFYNAAILLDKGGAVKTVYRKIKLVPFGEYVPLRGIFRFIDILNEIGDISAGREITRFSYNNRHFGVLICFEDVFPLLVRTQAQRNDFLINITNDAWFNGYPEVDQHLGVMALRAVENRKSIVRCANTGISGYVDYSGRIHPLSVAGKKIFVEKSESFSVPVYTRGSVYNKYGEWFSVICMVTVLAAAKINDGKKRK